MLKFFRKIRYNLMETGKMAKYFKYATGEIVLVVIGILIALQINNWNEDRKATEREHELLLQLNEELVDTKKELDTDLRNAATYYKMTDSVIFYNEKESQHPLPYYFLPQGQSRFYNNSRLFGNKSTYTTLKSTGLEIIKNPVLRNNITDLYERRYIRVRDTEDLIFTYGDRLIAMMERSFEQHYHEPTKELVLVPKDFESYQQNKEFHNTLINLQRYRRSLLERYQAIDSITGVIQRLIIEETKD